MDTNSRENKRGTASRRTRGAAKEARNGPQATPKGDTGVDGHPKDSRWGNRPKQGGRPDGDKSKEKDAEQEEDWFNENWGPHSMSTYQLKELCTMMARLLLRHSDQLAINRCEAGYMLFLQAQGMLSLVADLYQVAQVWKQAKEQAPETITLPLRVVMFKHVIDLLLSRLEACQATETSAKEAQEMLILDEHHNIPYLEWDPKAKTLRIKKDKEALPMAEATRILKDLQRLVLIPLVVMRFHSTRKLVKEHKGEILPMMLQIGYRTPEAQLAWNHLSRLTRSGLFRTCALSFRAEKMGRSALEVAIQRLLSES